MAWSYIHLQEFSLFDCTTQSNTNMPDPLSEATGTLDQMTVFCSKLGLLSNRGTWVTSRVSGILHVSVGRVWWKGKRGERLPWALFLADGLLFSRPYTLATRILWSLEWTLDTRTKSENAPGREQCGTNKAKLVRVMTRGFSQSGEDS